MIPISRISLSFVALLVALMSMLPEAFAQREKFSEGWSFHLGDTSGARKADFDDQKWRVLDVPHDWSIEGEYSKDNPMGDTGGYLPAGIGWYRKTVEVPAEWKGKHVEIAFDGVFMNSTVWANGQKLGNRPYGWSSFSYDISKQVAEASTVTFAVRVDNSLQPAARWYTGSGIYADVWIDVKEMVHVPASGVFVRTQGDVAKVDTEVANVTGNPVSASLKTRVLDADGKEVGAADAVLNVPAGGRATGEQSIILGEPRLWSLEDPYLYTLVSEVWVDGKLTDGERTRFGVREVEWIPESGMWLNGENVKLQGVCNHQDAGALGAAVPEKILRFRIKQLKDMGCNAIRTAHNPQTPIFYDICDEMGMLVMDEIFDGWGKKALHDYGGRFFDKWWERDLTDWIKRDRNHPSVVIYSLGNETHGDIAKQLVAKCHELDPTRPVTSGDSNPDEMDVLGVNGRSEKGSFFRTLKTDKVFIGTENTHTWQVRGFYRTMTWYRDGFPNSRQQPMETPDLTEKEIFTHDWIDPSQRANRKQIFNSSYDNAYVRLNSRQNIQQLRDIPNYAGSFRWTGHDYIGEAGYVHGGWPFKAFMGGPIDMANFEKDLYHLYRSQWTKKPMVHILPHWTHPTMEPGTLIPVWIYSNCKQVELFLNGKSLGKRWPGTRWNQMQCEWMVPWQPGEIVAKGLVNGKVVCSQVIRTASAPAQIAVSVDGEPLAAEGKDIVQVRVAAQDASGEFYPYGENRSHFFVIGPGRVRALDNGSPVDVEKHYLAEDRIAFYGLTRAYIEATGQQGDIALLTSCILGEKKLITSQEVSIDVNLLALRGETPDAQITVHYTTDGTLPITTSPIYEKPFTVELGTTVKALVVLNGMPVSLLKERFAADEGFVWTGGQAVAQSGGEQAEHAKLTQAQVSTEGEGYHGNGFINFGNAKGATIEWYQENDGDAGPATLVIRYSGNAKNKAGLAMALHVNGKITHPEFSLPNTGDWGKTWNTVKLPIELRSGANTIKLETIANGGPYIDEISFE
ncbi:MAG: glycoside hydrolase family 2 TIM barrel-domain containing protein [Luteolibacter sp.]